MKEKFQQLVVRLVKNQLVKGSATLFLGNLAGNFGNYLYHLVMGRMLGPSDYGALESVISLVYIFGIPLMALNLAVIKIVSRLRGQKQEAKIASFYHHLNRQIFWVGLISGLFLSFFSPLIKNFLHLDSLWPILMTVFYSFIWIFVGINSSVLNALLKFPQVSLINIIAAFSKLIMAIILVWLGFSVLGATGAFFLGSLLSFLFSRHALARLIQNQKKSAPLLKIKDIARQTFPFFILTLSFTSLYTVDVILARHFLSADQAGFYAALSVLGKIIFFATQPVILVMFPLVTARHAAGEDYQKLFFLGLFLVFLISLGVTGVYLLFPELMVKIPFGSQYLSAAKHLVIFGLFLSFHSLGFLVANFFLSLSQNQAAVLPVFAAALQALLVTLFHQSLTQIAWISTGVCGLLFASLMVYFLISPRKLAPAQTHES